MEDFGVLDAIAPEVRKKIADDLCVSAENQGLAFGPAAGRAYMGDQQETIDRLNREIAANHRIESAYHKAIAKLAHVEPHNIQVQNGKVIIL